MAQLEHAIDRCATAADAVLVIRALDRFGGGDEARARCLERGARHAATALDWLALHRVADDGAGCLERAAPLASEEERLHLAFLSRRYDDPRPERPPVLAPGELLLDGARSLGWRHAPGELFERFRRTIGPEQLASIADADYGMDAPAHLAALEQIVETGRIPHPLYWEPAEVLQLVRWTEGADTDHLARAFACTVLCLEDAGPTSHHEGNESTIATLLHSCLVLGTAAVEDALGLFAAMANEHGDPVVRAFVELALLLAGLWRDPEDRRLAPLLDRLVHDEASLRRDHTVNPSWLLGLTYFDQRHELWRELVRAIAVARAPVASRLAGLLR